MGIFASKFPSLEVHHLLVNATLILYWAQDEANLYLPKTNASGVTVLGPGFYTPQSVCPELNCLVTSDQDYLPYAQVVYLYWFSMRDGYPSDPRDPAQLWAMFTAESPHHTPHLDEYTGLEVNVTVSYRTDSDVWSPYGQTRRRLHPESQASMSHLEQTLKTKVEANGTSLVGWFVSNCDTPSGREKYVQELQKHLPVDIYGYCGPLECSRADANACYQMLSDRYLFYLSFENSLCVDYVTEKVFGVMQYNVIPIVYGWANYTQLLPPHSFIDATRMAPAELAKLLQDIASDYRKYVEYFHWRRHYKVDYHNSSDYLYCALCREAQARRSATNSNMKMHSSKTAKQINQWFFDDKCKDPSELMKNLNISFY